MENLVQIAVWHQFGASLDMLENAITACPAGHWESKDDFWYICFHTLFFLDYYSCTNPADFSPPAPFTESEFEDLRPSRVYTKEELLAYLTYSRNKIQATLAGFSRESASQRWINQSRTMDYSLLEIILYNLRHVQHHTGQLNWLLSKRASIPSEWIYETDKPL